MGEPDEPLDGALRRIAREIDDDDVDARLAWRSFAHEVLRRDEPAVTIGRFELRHRIGAGSFGRVYAAWDPRLQRTVALKLHQRELLPEGIREQFLREAQALAQLAHPNVVQVFGFGDSPHGLYFAMEHVEGPTLHAWQGIGDRRWRDVVHMHVQLADGIAATHAVGFVHADVKPSNVVVAASGRPCLVDFGLVGMRAQPNVASCDDADGISTLAVGGTPGYAAPEQLVHGTVDARSDQFSFCVGLYEGLAGSRPFTVQAIGGLGRGELTVAREYRAIGGVPRRLDRVLARGLSEDPAQRYPSMGALAEALRAVLGSGPQAAWVVGSLLVIGAGVMVLGERDRCSEVERDDVALHRLGGALRGDGADAAMVDEVIASLEHERSHWTQAREQVCATGTAEPMAFDRSMSCLQRSALAQQHLVRTLIDQPETRARLSDLRAELIDPSSCIDAGGLEQDTRAIAVLQTLDRGRMELAAGHPLAAVSIADDAVVAAERAELGPTLAEALLLQARGLDELGRDREAHDVLLRAAELAEAHRADALLPPIWHTLARLTAFDLAAIPEATRFAAHGDAALARLAHPPQLEVDAAITRAVIAEGAGDFAASERELEVALALLRSHADPRDHRMLAVLERLGNAAAREGDWARADALYATVLERRVERLGADHPDVLITQFNIGLNHGDRGEWDAARRSFEHVLAGQLERFGTSVRCAPTLAALARAELYTDALGAAREHAEQAWALQRDHLPPGHEERGSALALLSTIHGARNDVPAMLRVNLLRLAELDSIGSELDRVQLSNNIGWSLCELGECDRALPYYERVATHATEPAHRIAGVHGLARVAQAQGDRDTARLRFEQALAQALTLDDDAIARERAEIELHLAELLDVVEPGSPRIVVLARSAADSYARMQVDPDALARARALL